MIIIMIVNFTLAFVNFLQSQPNLPMSLPIFVQYLIKFTYEFSNFPTVL